MKIHATIEPTVKITLKSLIDRTQLIQNLAKIEGLQHVIPVFDGDGSRSYQYIVIVSRSKSMDVLGVLENLDYVDYAQITPTEDLMVGL